MNSLDPRAKLFWSFAWMIILFLVYRSIGQLLGAIILMILISGISLKTIFHSIRYLLIFLPITFLVHLLISSQGWRWLSGAIVFDVSMLSQPTLFTLRLGNLILFMAFVIKWIKDIDFIDAVYHLLKPLRRFKWRVDDFFQIIFISVKFFPILKEEYARLDEGWKVFSPVAENRISERVQRVRKSLIPLMIFSFQRAETLADAISIRGYDSAHQRSYFKQLRFNISDWLICGVAICGLFAVITWI